MDDLTNKEVDCLLRYLGDLYRRCLVKKDIDKNKEKFILYMDMGLSVLASPQETLLRKTYFEINDTKWWMEFYSKTTYYRERDRASRTFLRCVM